MFPNSILTFVFILFTFNLNAKDYYVSSKTGNDSNPGTLNNPFRTIQKAADIMNSGDVCIIRGGVYYEKVIVKDNNVIFKNYNNEKVIVSGASPIKNWIASKQGPGIYEAPFSGRETQFSMLFLNNKRQKMARWPNNTTDEMMNPRNKQTGYEACEAFPGLKGRKRKKVVFPNLSGFPRDHFKGGVFRGITGKKWMNPMGTIVSSNGKELQVDAITKEWVNAQPVVTDDTGYGYIFHLNALDMEGEWFESNNKIYFKPPGGRNPNNMNITAKKRKFAFDLTNRSSVTIQGINIHAASLEMVNTNSCKILKSSVQYLWPFFTRTGYAVSKREQGGIFIEGSNNLFKDSYIAHSWGHGIFVNKGRNNKIENCRLEDLGWIGQFTSSIQNFGDNTIVTRSTLGSTGRFHIRTNGSMKVTHNDIYDCMKMGQDAGSIQATNGGDWGNVLDLKGSEFAYNLIHDSTTLPWRRNKQFVLAFYLEGCSNYTVHHNIVYNFKTDIDPEGTFVYLGPRFTHVENAYYYNNTMFNCDRGVTAWQRIGNEGTGRFTNVRMWNNLLDAGAKDSENTPGAGILRSINKQNEIRYAHNQANNIFVDPSKGNFSLKPGSSPINKGRNIFGITEGHVGSAPDVGAVEFGKNFPKAGANFNSNAFNLDTTPNTGGNNNPPSLAITYPKNNQKYTLGQNVYMLANPSDSDGSISKVEFYDGAQLLHSRTTAPYEFPYRTAPAGNRTIRIVAFDDKGKTTEKSVRILVENNNIPPSLTITFPKNNQKYALGQNVYMLANPSDSDGSISKVEFYDGAQLIHSRTVAPYAFSYRTAPAGNRTIKIVAFDNQGKTTEKSVRILVGNNNFFRSSSITNNKKDDLELVVYPNPADNEIYISKLQSNHITWKLVNVLSEELLSGNTEKIDISTLPSGTYYLILSNGLKSTIIKK
ncbi:Ig-like domain-containing protein [Tenacibaculum sp. M341]|uniref:Ig-like domain-containing protein n=1 Tax=Tenacibaculum sp. M341 TaxID=2530339 RepID=UPI0010430D8D|nr:Ig-like domain-containing protein [Tenacibaculum sp. M341]TCI84892.1 T9SS type A sorting domain-containing protein [Tenacibaculum sp. M341]